MDNPESFESGHPNPNSLSTFGQTVLLFKKNFLSKKRQERKKLAGVKKKFLCNLIVGTVEF